MNSKVVGVHAFVISIACMAAPQRAEAYVTFNWEHLPSTGVFSSVSQTIGGLTATAAGVGGPISVVQYTLPSMSEFGSRSLIGGSNPNYLAQRITFSQDVKRITVWFGDDDVDDDGLAWMRYYTSDGVELGATNYDYGTRTIPRPLTVAAPNIRYIICTFSGGSPQVPNSAAWDNFEVTVVPEPATWAVLGLGFLASIGKRRKSDPKRHLSVQPAHQSRERVS